MDEDFLDVTDNSSKRIVAILLFIVLSLLVLGYVFVYKPHHFGLKQLTFEINSELPQDINEYLKKPVVSTSLYKLDLSKVKTDEVGTYEYTISINKNKQKGKIKIVDTNPPEYKIKQNVKVEVDNEDFFIGDVIETCTDASLPCLISYKNDKDINFLKSVGKHSITIVISDIYKNKKEETIEIEVVKKGTIVTEEELDLTFAKASSELPGFKNEYYFKLDKALKPDSKEAEDKAGEIPAEKTLEFVKAKYPQNSIKESEIVSMYNKSGYIIGFVVKITLNNDKIVYMTEK